MKKIYWKSIAVFFSLAILEFAAGRKMNIACANKCTGKATPVSRSYRENNKINTGVNDCSDYEFNYGCGTQIVFNSALF